MIIALTFVRLVSRRHYAKLRLGVAPRRRRVRNRIDFVDCQMYLQLRGPRVFTRNQVDTSRSGGGGVTVHATSRDARCETWKL
jgi:hypothetical protein